MEFTTRALCVLAIVPFLLAGLSGCSSSAGRSSVAAPVISVRVQEATVCDGEAGIAYSGTIEEVLSVPLTFAVIGTVADVRVHEGERVHKGQLLATLNDETWRNTYNMMSAKQRQAEDAYARMQPMHESGSLPDIKWVEVETGREQARAATAVAQKNLEDCRLYATVDGIVGRRGIEPGMGANPALPAITLVRIDTVYARVSVSESEIARVRPGMAAALTVSALGKARFTGNVEQIGVMADPFGHTYKVKIAVPNLDHRLLPGMLCSVSLRDNADPVGVVVPANAISEDGNGSRYLFVVDTSRRVAARREITLGELVKTGIRIQTGLQPGELVVVAGQQKLTDQSLITWSR